MFNVCVLWWLGAGSGRLDWVGAACGCCCFGWIVGVGVVCERCEFWMLW